MSELKIKLAYLFPKLLNIYGDYGNIMVLKYRTQSRGIQLEVEEISENDLISVNSTDFYFLGGGQDIQQLNVSAKIQKHKLVLMEACDKNAVFLGICGGYQLLGNYYQSANGAHIVGLGLMNLRTVAGENRLVGNLSATANFLTPNTIVGFENHIGQTFLEEGVEPLFDVVVGCGNNGEDGFEGARFKNAFGTYLHGPFLAKNPHFADYLISLALQKRYNDDIPLKPLNDELEYLANETMFKAKY